jgi:hypothetical protein
VSTYVLPFYITEVDADSILEPKRYNVVGTRFENMLFGNYWHGGSAFVVRPGHIRGDTTIVYQTTIPVPENLIWTLTTAGPSTLTCNGYGNATVTAGKRQFNMTLKGTKIYFRAGADAKYPFIPVGVATFNNTKLLQNRKIFLKYTYTDPVTTYTWTCTDTLTFRNRIRDGINEWQDENPSHYTK